MKTIKKLRKYLRRRDGFTLMELIVVIAIIGIVGAGLVTLLVPSISIYTQSMSLSQGKLIAQGMCGQIAGELTYATAVKSLSADSVTYMNPNYGPASISAREDGDGVQVLLGSSTDIGFDSKYYMSKDTTVGFEWGDAEHTVILVTVTVSEGTDTLNTFTRPVRLINLKTV